MFGIGGDARRFGLRWIARLLRADLLAEDWVAFEADLEVARRALAREPQAEGAAAVAGPVVDVAEPLLVEEMSAIRMLPRRFQAWRSSIACWPRVWM